MSQSNILKKFFVKLQSCWIKDKEERKVFRFNKLHKDAILFLGNSYAIPPLFIANPKTVIGKFTSIAANVAIGTDSHPLDFVSTSPKFYQKDEDYINSDKLCKPVQIENDVWVGRNVIIMDGIHIGTVAVIGAGAIVTKDVPPYAIVVGVPARLLRYRFNEDLRNRLIASKWWDYPLDVLKGLPYKNPELFLEKLKEVSLDD